MPLIVTEPIYRQVLRRCQEQIASGEFPSDSKFPSERELAQHYGISRATANKVISSLVAEKLVCQKRGIGTFVTPHRGLQASLLEMESFTGHALAHGFKPSTEVLSLERHQPADLPPVVAAALAPAEGETVLYTERLRRADGEPVILEYRWIRASLVPGLKRRDLEGSFYALLGDRYRLPLLGERHSIGARAATPEIARLLAVRQGEPLLVVEGPGFTANRTPLWYQVLHYRADRYRLENEVGSRTEPSDTRFRFSKNPAPSRA